MSNTKFVVPGNENGDKSCKELAVHAYIIVIGLSDCQKMQLAEILIVLSCRAVAALTAGKNSLSCRNHKEWFYRT